MSEKKTGRDGQPGTKIAKIGSAWLFGYAVVVGTSAPVVLSRCQGSCASCGGCVVLLGLVPLVVFAAAKDRVRGAVRRLLSIGKRRGS
jgi:uncharacterized membrane protein YeiB